MTHTEIDALTLSQTIFTVLNRLHPDVVFKLIDEESEVVLTNIKSTPSTVVTQTEVDAEFIVLKNELHAEETYREVLNTKKEEAQVKFDLVKDDYQRLSKKAGLPHVANPSAWFRDNCLNVYTHEEVIACISKLTNVESKLSELATEDAEEAESSTKAEVIKKALKNFNVNSIDSMDVTQLRTVIKNIIKVLKHNYGGKL